MNDRRKPAFACRVAGVILAVQAAVLACPPCRAQGEERAVRSAREFIRQQARPGTPLARALRLKTIRRILHSGHMSNTVVLPYEGGLCVHTTFWCHGMDESGEPAHLSCRIGLRPGFGSNAADPWLYLKIRKLDLASRIGGCLGLLGVYLALGILAAMALGACAREEEGPVGCFAVGLVLCVIQCARIAGAYCGTTLVALDIGLLAACLMVLPYSALARAWGLAAFALLVLGLHLIAGVIYILCTGTPWALAGTADWFEWLLGHFR